MEFAVSGTGAVCECAVLDIADEFADICITGRTVIFWCRCAALRPVAADFDIGRYITIACVSVRVADRAADICICRAARNTYLAAYLRLISRTAYCAAADISADAAELHRARNREVFRSFNFAEAYITCQGRGCYRTGAVADQTTELKLERCLIIGVDFGFVVVICSYAYGHVLNICRNAAVGDFAIGAVATDKSADAEL